MTFELALIGGTISILVVAYFTYDPQEDCGTSNISDDVIDRTILRRCSDRVSIVAGNTELLRAISLLEDDLIKSESINCRRTRMAYKRWVPYFISDARRYIKMNDEQDDFQKNKGRVPSLPTPQETE